MSNDAKPNRKHFWWMIFTVLLFCSIPLLIGMVPEENRVAWRLQSQGCNVICNSVDGGFWGFHPTRIFCGKDFVSSNFLTNEILQQFPKMSHIAYVKLSSVELDGLDMKPLTEMPDLRQLVFFCCANLSTDELQKLGNCSKLEILSICGTHVTRDDIQAWKKCPLDNLDLTLTQLTNDELEEIAKFSPLSQLTVGGNLGITDEGLEHLLKLEHLVMLFLGDTSVTKEGIEDFRKKHPNAHLKIYGDF